MIMDVGTNPFHGSYASRIPWFNHINKWNIWNGNILVVTTTIMQVQLLLQVILNYFGMGALSSGNADELDVTSNFITII